MVKRYLLDSNIIIAYFRGDESILKKVETLDGFYVSAVTLGELYLGAILSNSRTQNIMLISDLLQRCVVNEINQETAYHYAEIKAYLKKSGKLIPDNDMWIAATALENHFTIITQDKHLLNTDIVKTEAW